MLGNYPISAYLRIILEAIRPEMRQYFFEDEVHALLVGTANPRWRRPWDMADPRSFRAVA